jgi:hypothetical protein
MFAQSLSIATRPLWRFLTDRARRVQARRTRHLELRDSTRDSETRGLKLLREWLSPAQCAQFDANRYFDVTGCHSGKKYRIRYGSSANIEELDHTGHPVMGWCFVPNRHLVPGDVMLAQKIALETNERGALAVANKFPGTLPDAPFFIPARSREL